MTNATLASLTTDIEKADNASPKMHDIFDVGDRAAQGDILIARIPNVPKDAKPIPMNPQLAPGDTKGSRHILRDPSTVRMYAMPGTDPLIGPVVEFTAANWIDHPEHAAQGFPAGCYAITFQRTIVDGMIRRQQD